MLQRRWKWGMSPLVAVLLLVLAGCAATGTSAAKSAVPEKHWGYAGDTGPAYWYALNPAYAIAKAGRAQSPIAIGATDIGVSDTVAKPRFHYSAIRYELENNGHTIELVPEEADNTITLDGVEYVVQQFHFHSPSEHTVDGESFPLEMHIVHRDDQGNLAVVGVLFTEGAENTVLQEMFAKLPREPTHEGIALETPIDLSSFFTADAPIYRYDGSLTTPPCTEGVKWNLSAQPAAVSQGQLDVFHEAYTGNNRPVQALNGRAVYRAIR